MIAGCTLCFALWPSFAAMCICISTAGYCVPQARADKLLQQGIVSMNGDQANAEALLHETADAQRAAHRALEYEGIARVSLCFTT